ncbi:thioesterase-like superfamily-domain-containing protein [Parasitella parasitica]|nr:thioesterase-like superfamily-domain-containing protein [Parasitella parasitica]
MSTPATKVNFRENKNEGIVEQIQDVDFALKMRNAVDVQLIDTNLYMSKELWLPWGARGAFGGQVVAQALRAAWDTVDEDFFVHSLHAYFILACSVEIPVIYSIQRIREGKSYATRTVTATQKGKAIFICSCSFVKADDSVTLSHQTLMPQTVDPETLTSDIEVLKNTLAITESISENVKKTTQKRLEEDLAIDSRAVKTLSPQQVITGRVEPSPHSQRWFKTRGSLNDDMKLHACIIAYASDSGFITTAAAAHGHLINSRGLGMLASLDHSIWFHYPAARADTWLLYDVQSPQADNGRAIVFGKIYSQNGTLVATTAQEGILRISQREQEKRKKAAAAADAAAAAATNLTKSKL